MSFGYSNRHHGIPRSFLGSGDKGNISIIDIEEHNNFHAVAGHLPPDYLIRRMIVSSADWNDLSGKVLPATVFGDLLSELTPVHWRALYQEGTLHTSFRADHEKMQFAKTAIHVRQQICREQYDVADASNAVLNAKNISPQRTVFRDSLQRLFQQNNPADALKRYVLDVGHHDVKWVKPLSQSVRSRVLETLRRARPMKPEKNREQRMADIMDNHRRRLAVCMSNWEPRVAEFESVIIGNYKTVPLFRDYLQSGRSISS